MAADTAISIIQTGVMFAELAESRETNRLTKEANQISKDQMRQDMKLTLMQMKQERDLSNRDEIIRRELNSNLLDELNSIANSINGVEIAIRKGLDKFFFQIFIVENQSRHRQRQYQNEMDLTELVALPLLKNWLQGNDYKE